MSGVTIQGNGVRRAHGKPSALGQHAAPSTHAVVTAGHTLAVTAEINYKLLFYNVF
jgi:hypothetical protein